ncbi:hypothetical protein E2C01_037998 [Portunus trituberculatus]|uniref:Uncharacterized protein n=1 Tax=Portunus trituberculatus TaxID=210409 RepID=A0A5B7FIP8_PORTR|nr:hypothetical protein [Portunus trituberculatus]
MYRATVSISDRVTLPFFFPFTALTLPLWRFVSARKELRDRCWRPALSREEGQDVHRRQEGSSVMSRRPPPSLGSVWTQFNPRRFISAFGV